MIDNMKFNENSNLFGNEKDDSFRGSIGAIYQSLTEEMFIIRLKKKQQIYCIL